MFGSLVMGSHLQQVDFAHCFALAKNAPELLCCSDLSAWTGGKLPAGNVQCSPSCVLMRRSDETWLRIDKPRDTGLSIYIERRAHLVRSVPVQSRALLLRHCFSVRTGYGWYTGLFSSRERSRGRGLEHDCRIGESKQATCLTSFCKHAAPFF